MSIFDGVKFFCAPALADERKVNLTLLLEHNGAQPAPLGDATHIITRSLDYEGQDSANEGSVTVTDYWVDRSLILGRLQSVQHFSPDPTMLFSGVVACATDLVPSDNEVLSAGITALGGQWRAGLTRDVTHLFAVGPGSEKYQTALRYQKETEVKVLVPHWFDDSVRLGIRGLSTLAYEWPEPAILTLGKSSLETGEVGDGPSRPQNRLSQDKKMLYKAALLTAEQEAKLGQAETRDIWDSRRVLLGPDLDLSDDRRKAIEAGISRAGGVVVDCDTQRADAEYEFDILIARYRWGPLYVQSVNGRKLIGSLTWLFHVQSTGTIGAPTVQLLHYPIPKKPIDGFSSHEITVTNYTGDARDYLKKLIGLMGATFTPSMSGKNTVLIAAYISGNKATKARNWSIPVVNHTWLEDCFIQWRNLSVGLEKYVVFPPGLDFSDHLGERGIQREVILETLPDLIAEMSLARDKENSMEKGSIYRNGGSPSQVAVKRPCSRRVQEAEGLMDGSQTEHRTDVHVQFQPARDQGVEEDYMQVDGPLASGGSVANLECNRARKPSGRTGRTVEQPSPLRQPTPPPQRIHERPSPATKHRYRADPGTTEEEAPTPTKRLVYAQSAATGSPVMSSSKSRATTPRQMESVLMPPKGTGEVLGKSLRQSAKISPVKNKRKAGGTLSESISAKNYPPLASLAVDTSMDREEGPSRRTSRRSAASKATQRLRDEVMPDVINFERELRRGNVRAANLPKSEDAILNPSGNGKKRASVQLTLEDGASSDGKPERKRRRLSGAKANDRFKERDDDGRMDITGTSSQGSADLPSSKGGPKDAKAKKPSSSRDISDKPIGILATQVTLDESEEKALAKLGAKVGVKPDECTHLVVKTLARTEKLLCAMAVAPVVVTEKWVRDSIAAKKLLPADKYALVDPVNEKKWGFKLTDALKRAKAKKGQLFVGITFYVTNKVPVDKRLLKNVVSAHGGQLRQQNPTVRALSGKGTMGHQHYVISCSEDASIWRPIAEAGHPIYSHELILSAALTQEIYLNAEGVRVDTP